MTIVNDKRINFDILYKSSEAQRIKNILRHKQDDYCKLLKNESSNLATELTQHLRPEEAVITFGNLVPWAETDTGRCCLRGIKTALGARSGVLLNGGSRHMRPNRILLFNNLDSIINAFLITENMLETIVNLATEYLIVFTTECIYK